MRVPVCCVRLVLDGVVLCAFGAVHVAAGQVLRSRCDYHGEYGDQERAWRLLFQTRVSVDRGITVFHIFTWVGDTLLLLHAINM